MENLLLKHIKVSNVCSIFFKKQVKKVILQLHLKNWYYHGKQPLLPLILQVILQDTWDFKVIDSQFWKELCGLLQLGTTPEFNYLLRQLACLIFPSFKFYFLWKFNFELNKKKKLLGDFYLMLKKGDIMEKSVWMSCIKMA